MYMQLLIKTLGDNFCIHILTWRHSEYLHSTYILLTWCLSFVNYFVNCVITVNSRKKTSKTMWKIVVCITQTVMLWSKHLLKKVRVKNCSKTYMINTCESYVCTMYHNGFKIFFEVALHFLNLSYLWNISLQLTALSFFEKRFL